MNTLFSVIEHALELRELQVCCLLTLLLVFCLLIGGAWEELCRSFSALAALLSPASDSISSSLVLPPGTLSRTLIWLFSTHICMCTHSHTHKHTHTHLRNEARFRQAPTIYFLVLVYFLVPYIYQQNLPSNIKIAMCSHSIFLQVKKKTIIFPIQIFYTLYVKNKLFPRTHIHWYLSNLL